MLRRVYRDEFAKRLVNRIRYNGINCTSHHLAGNTMQLLTSIDAIETVNIMIYDAQTVTEFRGSHGMEEGKGERYLASGRQYGNALLGVRHQEEETDRTAANKRTSPLNRTDIV